MKYMMGLHFPESRHMQAVVKEDHFQQSIPGFGGYPDRGTGTFRGLQELKEKAAHCGIQVITMFGDACLENPVPEIQKWGLAGIIGLWHATKVTGELHGENQVKERKIVAGTIQMETGIIKKRKEFRVRLFFMNGLIDKFVEEECNGTFPDVEGNGLVRMRKIRLL